MSRSRGAAECGKRAISGSTEKGGLFPAEVIGDELMGKILLGWGLENYACDVQGNGGPSRREALMIHWEQQCVRV